ncbi:MAG: nuclear transport factor 2 family protein [Bacteriovoracia bacterium]
MNQKESATQFLERVAAGQVSEAYERFISPDFIHHNPYFKGDRESLMLAMQTAHRMNPQKQIQIKHVYEDGNTVITHSHVRQRPEDPGAAVVHVFKFRDAKIAELWDVGQPLAVDSPNANGPF